LLSSAWETTQLTYRIHRSIQPGAVVFALSGVLDSELAARLEALIASEAIQFNYDPDAAPQIAIEQWIPAFYLPVTAPGTGFNARTDLLNSIFFIPSRDNVLDGLKRQQSEVWYYRFDWDQEPAPFNDIYGAAHAFDLAFVFGSFGPSLFSKIEFSTANRPGRLELSETMMQSLGAFARTGDPNTPALGVTWPVWPAMLKFDATTTHKVISVE